jgi:hypothetical protein
MNMNKRLTDEELRATVVAALRGQPDTVWKRFTHEHGIYEITRLNVSTELVCRAIESAVLARAAVPAVQPKVYKAGDLHFDSDVCLASQVLAAPQAEARQEQPKQPDSVYSAQPSGEATTARDAAESALRLAEIGLANAASYEGRSMPTHEVESVKTALAAVRAALSSTPGDGGTGGVAGLEAVTADAERLCWSLRPLVRLVPAGSGECWVRFKVGSQEFTIGNQPLAEDEAAHFAGLFVFALAGAFRTLPAGVAPVEAPSQHPDTILLDFIASEYLDVSAFAMPTGAGDADVGWKLVQEHEGNKGRVEVACHYRDDLRAAIREAMQKLGYTLPADGVQEVPRG